MELMDNYDFGEMNFSKFVIEALKNGKSELLKMLSDIGVKVFYFGTLTKSGNPRHPLQRQEKWDF